MSSAASAHATERTGVRECFREGLARSRLRANKGVETWKTSPSRGAHAFRHSSSKCPTCPTHRPCGDRRRLWPLPTRTAEPARAASVRTIGDEHEVEVRPLLGITRVLVVVLWEEREVASVLDFDRDKAVKGSDRLPGKQVGEEGVASGLDEILDASLASDQRDLVASGPEDRRARPRSGL